MMKKLFLISIIALLLPLYYPGTSHSQIGIQTKTVIEDGVRKTYVINRVIEGYDSQGKKITKKLPDVLEKEVPLDKNGQPHGEEIYYGHLSHKTLGERKVSKITTYKHGTKDGDETEFTYSGKVKTVTPYVDGKIEGRQIEYYKNSDQEKTVTPYVKGKEDGDKKEYFPNGDLEYETPYANGKKDGIMKSYFKDSKKLRYISEYEDGKSVGVSTQYNEDGFVIYESHQDGDKETFKIFKGDGSGTIIKEDQYNVDDDGIHTKIINYPDGSPKEIIRTQGGGKHGHQLTYWPNGKIHTSEHYKNGFLDGVSEQFREDGKPVKWESYTREQLHGESWYYFDTHIEQVQFEYNERHGETIIYNDFMGKNFGIPSKIIPYEYGKIHGVVQTYSNLSFETPDNSDFGTIRKPNLVKKETYENGKLNGITEYYEVKQWGHSAAENLYDIAKKTFMYKTEMYKDGLLHGDTILYNAHKGKTVIPYVNNLIEGMKTEYDANGTVLSEVPHVAGQFQGTAKFYSSKGKLIRSVGYEKNSFHGNQVTYFENGNPMRIEPYDMGNLHGIVVDYNVNGAIMNQTSYNKGVHVADKS